MNELKEILEYFNEVCGTNLKATPTKRDNIKKFLEYFSVEDIKKGILNRTKSNWHRQNGVYKDWQSLFGWQKSIDAFERWTNMDDTDILEDDVKRGIDAFAERLGRSPNTQEIENIKHRIQRQKQGGNYINK